MHAPELLAELADSLRALGAGARRIHSGGEAASVVSEIVRRVGGPRAVLYEPSVLAEALGLHRSLRALGIQVVPVADARNVAAGLTVGITGARAAIAASGTLLIGGRNGGWGLATVLPWIHVALLDEQDIYPDLAAVFPQFSEEFAGGDRDWVWVSGPSKTADIAHTLVRGIHGPNGLQVLVYGDER